MISVKKVICTLVTAVMVASTATVAYAEDTNSRVTVFADGSPAVRVTVFDEEPETEPETAQESEAGKILVQKTSAPTYVKEPTPASSEHLNVSASQTYVGDPYAFQVNSSSGVPIEFWEEYLDEDLKDLAEGLVYCDQMGINALYLYSVAVTEVGWDCEVVGQNNYFNYTVDTVDYQDFSTPMDCFKYTASRYLDAYFVKSWHLQKPINYYDMPAKGTINLSDDVFTITELNRRYAINSDYSINWQWQDVVAEILVEVSNDYQDWVNSNV